VADPPHFPLGIIVTWGVTPCTWAVLFGDTDHPSRACTVYSGKNYLTTFKNLGRHSPKLNKSYKSLFLKSEKRHGNMQSLPRPEDINHLNDASFSIIRRHTTLQTDSRMSLHTSWTEYPNRLLGLSHENLCGADDNLFVSFAPIIALLDDQWK